MATNDILLIPTPLQSSIPSCCLGLIALVTMVMMMINTVDWSVVETSFADTSNHPTRRLQSSQHTIKKSWKFFFSDHLSFITNKTHPVVNDIWNKWITFNYALVSNVLHRILSLVRCEKNWYDVEKNYWTPKSESRHHLHRLIRMCLTFFVFFI